MHRMYPSLILNIDWQMALLAYLMLGDNSATSFVATNSYKLKEFNLEIKRNHSHLIPVGDPGCVKIKITINPPIKGDLILQDWINQNKVKEGRIKYISDDSYTTDYKEIIFYNAYCVEMKEESDVYSGKREMNITLISENVMIDTVTIS